MNRGLISLVQNRPGLPCSGGHCGVFRFWIRPIFVEIMGLPEPGVAKLSKLNIFAETGPISPVKNRPISSQLGEHIGVFGIWIRSILVEIWGWSVLPSFVGVGFEPQGGSWRSGAQGRSWQGTKGR